jgi:short-subunit dehydrogenase
MTLAPGSTDTDALIKQGVDKSKLSGLMSPDRVAQDALEALGRKRLFMPGRANRFLIRLMTGLPRRWGLAMAESGMKASMKQ